MTKRGATATKTALFPTFRLAWLRTRDAWRATKGRPLAHDSPFFYPCLIVFLWAFHGFSPRLVLTPILWAIGYGGSYDRLINASLPIHMLTRSLWVCYYIGMVILALRLSGLTEEEIGWRRPRGSLTFSLAAGALAGGGFMLLRIYGWEPLLYSLKHWRPYPAFRHVAPITDHDFFLGDPSDLVYALQNLLFFFPLIEDLAYRGVLYELFSRRRGRTVGALASSFLFACVHYTRGDFAYLVGIHLGDYGTRRMSEWGTVFLSGLLFCWLKDRRRGLAMPAAAHTAGNMVAELLRVTVSAGSA